MSFASKLSFGQVAESLISNWILSRNGYVLPVYETEIDNGKGPRLFTPDGELVAPDLLVVSRTKKVLWIEAKHKTVFTWHRISNQWTTGIDLHHYEQYKQVAIQVGWPVWLLFFHRNATPDHRDIKNGCPSECPVGLFGNTIDVLSECENHRHSNHGTSGMVYWNHGSLKWIATKEQVENSRKPAASDI